MIPKIRNAISASINKAIIFFGVKPLLLFVLLLIFGSGLIAFFPETSSKLEFWLYDQAAAIFAGTRKPSSDLVIVAIDMKTLDAAKHRWPWPRKEMASVISLLQSYQPKAILVDIIFQGNQAEEGDQMLAKAISDSRNVFLVSMVEEKQTSSGNFINQFSSNERFVSVAKEEGFVWGIIDSDYKIRRFKAFDRRLDLESAAMKMAQLESADPAALLSGADSPAISFATYEGGIPTISLYSVLNQSPEIAEILKNKIILLGTTAEPLHDFHSTPLGIWPGVRILAASLDTLLSRRPGFFFFNHFFFRSIALAAGFFLGSFFTFKFGWKGNLFFVVIFPAAIAFSHSLRLYYPFGPFIYAWLLASCIILLANYFKNIFYLQEMRIEGAAAMAVQEQLFPPEPLELNGYSVEGFTRPATMVGGDYYDYFKIGERYILTFIGDATGHGIPAALATAVAKAAVLSDLSDGFKPETFFSRVNLLLFSSLNRKVMMTAAVCLIDTFENTFEYWNCGHPYPYQQKQGGEIIQLKALGIFFGTKARYKVGQSFKNYLQPGEKLIFYSDGLVESFSESFDLDGYELFREYLNTQLAGNPSNLSKTLIDLHPHHATGRPQPDDFTVLVIERNISSFIT